MGLRSGTLATPLCVGFGEACAIAEQDMPDESKRIQDLTNQLYHGITSQLSHVYLNGSLTHRVPGNLNMSFDCVEGEGLMMAIKNLAVSSGSACTSSSLEPSYVLKALGIPDSLSHTSLRFGIGRFTTEEEVRKAIDDIVKAVNKLRDLSPLWEMKQEGIDISLIQWAS
jgi:cysteine desulfurase